MNKVEMSLDDIIKNNKDIRQQARRPRGGVSTPRRGGRDKIRRLSGGSNFKRSPGRRGGNAGRPFIRSRSASASNYRSSAPYSKGDINGTWSHDLYSDVSGYSTGGRTSGSGKLLISNLDFGVNDTDIKELFSEFGLLKSAKLHYDRSGRSLGTADLVYERRSDAISAMKQYNGVPLDGRPMQIALAADVSVIENSSRGRGAYRNSNIRSFRGAPRGGSYRGRGGRGSGPPRGGRGGSGGAGRGGPKPTQEQLDAELDAYIEKMDVS